MAEHTGGIDEKSTIDFDHYSVDELAEVIHTPPYQRMIQSWNDSRDYANKAIHALDNSVLENEARNELSRLIPRQPDLKGYNQFIPRNTLRTKYFSVQFDAHTGAILSLLDTKNKAVYSNDSVPLGLFWHESFSEQDYARWANQYLLTKEE
jgi:hypothetical protein